MDNLFAAAEQFASNGKVIDIRDLGSGNINRTFLVTLDAEGNGHFVLQSINRRVFHRPELVLLNMRTATEHIIRRLMQNPPAEGRRWEVPRVLPAKDGGDHWLASDGSFWRAVSFIEGSESFDTVRDISHAGEVGYAVGVFHTLLSDLPPERLFDTLEGFHVTPLYLRHYDVVTAKKCHGRRTPEADYCAQFVSRRRAWASVLEDAREKGGLLLRPIHGDPKVNNIMIETATNKAISIVDLDTVKPGLVHYDIGDCLRSGCNLLGEETGYPEAVRFDTDLCRGILGGYLSAAGDFLTPRDFDYLYDAIRLIAFELGLRFFTDYLEGDIYFKVKSGDHNLVRALVQFRLTESIESEETAIRTIIRDLR